MSNRMWISTVGGYQFRCPRCGEQFRAQRAAEHLVAAAYCFIVRTSNAWTYTLAEWPSSNEESFFLELTEHQAGIRPEDRLLDDDALAAKVAEALDQDARPYLNLHFELSAETKAKIDTLNEASTKKVWSYEHLRGGFYACVYDYEEGKTPIMSYDQARHVVSLMALMLQRVKERGGPGDIDVISRRLARM